MNTLVWSFTIVVSSKIHLLGRYLKYTFVYLSAGANAIKYSFNFLSSNIVQDYHFCTLPLSSGRVLWYHIGSPSICLIHPSVFSFQGNNLSKCQWISTKLGMCIDIVEIWFGIASGQILSIFDNYLPAT